MSTFGLPARSRPCSSGVYQAPPQRNYPRHDPLGHFRPDDRLPAIVEHPDLIAVADPPLGSVHRVQPEALRLNLPQPGMVIEA